MKFISLLIALAATALLLTDLAVVLPMVMAGETVHTQLKDHLWQSPLVAALAWSFFAKA